MAKVRMQNARVFAADAQRNASNLAKEDPPADTLHVCKVILKHFRRLIAPWTVNSEGKLCHLWSN